MEHVMTPAHPPLLAGELWHRGWDIPTRWCVDAKGQCWMNNAHGSSLYPCTRDQLLELFTEEQVPVPPDLLRIFGFAPPAPVWMKTARDAGWTPPEGFDLTQYTWE